MRVEVGSANWQNLETLMGSSMTEGTSYDVQLVKGQQLMIVEGASEPQDDEDGNILEYNQGCTVKKDSNNVYVKSFNAGCIINVTEGE